MKSSDVLILNNPALCHPMNSHCSKVTDLCVPLKIEENAAEVWSSRRPPVHATFKRHKRQTLAQKQRENVCPGFHMRVNCGTTAIFRKKGRFST